MDIYILYVYIYSDEGVYLLTIKSTCKEVPVQTVHALGAKSLWGMEYVEGQSVWGRSEISIVYHMYVYIYKHTVYMHLSLSTSIHIHPQQHPAVGVPRSPSRMFFDGGGICPRTLGASGYLGAACFRGGFNRPQDGEWDRMGHHGIYNPYGPYV